MQIQTDWFGDGSGDSAFLTSSLVVPVFASKTALKQQRFQSSGEMQDLFFLFLILFFCNLRSFDSVPKKLQ